MVPGRRDDARLEYAVGVVDRRGARHRHGAGGVATEGTAVRRGLQGVLGRGFVVRDAIPLQGGAQALVRAFPLRGKLVAEARAGFVLDTQVATHRHIGGLARRQAGVAVGYAVRKRAAIATSLVIDHRDRIVLLVDAVVGHVGQDAEAADSVLKLWLNRPAICGVPFLARLPQ